MVLMGLTGCSIRTPEIRGVVLDEETRQPVEEAWITATLGIKTKTVGGDVRKYLSVEIPHTRTDKSGRFTIPSKRFKKPSFPFGFGTDIESFGLGASTVDDRGGSLNLTEFLDRGKADVTIYIKPDHTKDTEEEYFTYLQGLYNYCLTGRFYVEVPPVEGGCDEWELNYAITKHANYLERYRDSIEKDVNTVIFDRLANLYEKKSDYRKAIETLRKIITIIEAKGLLKFEVWQRNKRQTEWKINELQKKLEGVKK
jgi:tetratricopeptide (TPR) repeat protein